MHRSRGVPEAASVVGRDLWSDATLSSAPKFQNFKHLFCAGQSSRRQVWPVLSHPCTQTGRLRHCAIVGWECWTSPVGCDFVGGMRCIMSLGAVVSLSIVAANGGVSRMMNNTNFPSHNLPGVFGVCTCMIVPGAFKSSAELLVHGQRAAATL
jgi:hypothetical protein